VLIDLISSLTLPYYLRASYAANGYCF